MRIRTDDEVYRVDAVWLGPPKATFPFRARYVAWGVGFLVLLLVLGVERRLGIGFGFFSTAWGLLITILLTRLICARISHERPLSSVAAMWARELTAPRKRGRAAAGAVSAAKVTVRGTRPRPGAARPGAAQTGAARAGRARVMTTKEDRGVRART